jgi:glutamine amidotransferase
MILLINSGTSNLGSWISILERLEKKFILSDKKNWNSKDITKIIFPGIGNYYEVAHNISKFKLKEKIINLVKNKVPYLGICIGMQMLFKSSEESKKNNSANGLDLIKGDVLKISEKNIIVPHNGWNQISIIKKNKLLKSINSGSDFYFNHSYYCHCKDRSIITSVLSDNQNITTSLEINNIYGVQFHPEKSMRLGMQLIKNFAEIKC